MIDLEQVLNNFKSFFTKELSSKFLSINEYLDIIKKDTQGSPEEDSRLILMSAFISNYIRSNITIEDIINQWNEEALELVNKIWDTKYLRYLVFTEPSEEDVQEFYKEFRNKKGKSSIEYGVINDFLEFPSGVSLFSNMNLSSTKSIN